MLLFSNYCLHFPLYICHMSRQNWPPNRGGVKSMTGDNVNVREEGSPASSLRRSLLSFSFVLSHLPSDLNLNK